MVRLVYSFSNMAEVVAFAIQTLRELSPVGSTGDEHPGLYRDSHTIFLNGHVVKDVGAFRSGDQINISNPVPYARKIEAGRGKMSVPGHVYEQAAQIVADRKGNQALVKFTFMPVRFGDVAIFAAFSRKIRPGRRMSEKARRDWLVRQPALEIRAR
jgi:hypothetical protein